MSRLTWLLASLLVTTVGCSTDSGSGSFKPPTGAPRKAQGRLPSTANLLPAMKPKSVSAIKEMGGKPKVEATASVSLTGSFSLTLDVGVQYMFVITLESGATVQLCGSDASSTNYAWLPIGNPLDNDPILDFGSVTIVNGIYISTTVLLDTDWDGDGISDFDDPDDDNDGLGDSVDDDWDNDGEEDEHFDADDDGVPDLGDSDDDNDGIGDAQDADDDGDGIPDDQDPDNDFEICGDGIDNDDDGDIDEEDADCPVEREDEICGDGIDNDGDGYVDEDDDDCATEEFEVCDDGIDNDGDGYVDEDDADCK